MRYVCTIAYDGTNYAGWQRQNNAVTVQEIVENAMNTALGITVRVTASGRTDAGVHAVGQTFHFDENLTVPAEKLPDCLNRFLPPDIRILEGWQADETFDCNRSAKRKTYRYSLYDGFRDMPLKDRYAVRVENLPDGATLKKWAKELEGEHDYKAFCASGSAVKTTIRTVYEVRIEESQSYGSRDMHVYVTGNGFLYNMVRTMVGELLDLSWGKRTLESLQNAYTTGDRNVLGKTMPAKGLTLMRVDYQK